MPADEPAVNPVAERHLFAVPAKIALNRQHFAARQNIDIEIPHATFFCTGDMPTFRPSTSTANLRHPSPRRCHRPHGRHKPLEIWIQGIIDPRPGMRAQPLLVNLAARLSAAS